MLKTIVKTEFPEKENHCGKMRKCWAISYGSYQRQDLASKQLLTVYHTIPTFNDP